MNLKLTRLIAAAILFLGAFNMPYGYYKFVRISTFIFSGLFAYLSFKIKNELWIVLFGIILILFNPVYPMHFTKNIWAIIDLAAAAVFLISIKYADFTLLKKENEIHN